METVKCPFCNTKQNGVEHSIHNLDEIPEGFLQYQNHYYKCIKCGQLWNKLIEHFLIILDALPGRKEFLQCMDRLEILLDKLSKKKD